MKDVSTEFVRRHYSKGPTAYYTDGSIAKMPSPDDVEYAAKQFDRWLSVELARAWQTGRTAGIVAAQDFIPFHEGEFSPENPYPTRR